MLAGTAPTERSAAVGPRRSPPAAQPPAGAGCAVLKGQLRGARRAAGAARGGSAGSSRRDHFRVSAAASATRDHAEAGGCGAERGRPPPPFPSSPAPAAAARRRQRHPLPRPGRREGGGGSASVRSGRNSPRLAGGTGGSEGFFFFLFFFFLSPPRRSHVAAGDWSPPGPGRGWVCMRRAPSSPPLPPPGSFFIPGERVHCGPCSGNCCCASDSSGAFQSPASATLSSALFVLYFHVLFTNTAIFKSRLDLFRPLSFS